MLLWNRSFTYHYPSYCLLLLPAMWWCNFTVTGCLTLHSWLLCISVLAADEMILSLCTYFNFRNGISRQKIFLYWLINWRISQPIKLTANVMPWCHNDLNSVTGQQMKAASCGNTEPNTGAVSIRKTVLPGMAIPMLKIRRPNGRLIFNMEIAIRR